MSPTTIDPVSGPERAVRTRRTPGASVSLLVLKAVVLFALPFLSLIGVSVLTYRRYGLHPWLALATGVVVTSLVLTLYIAGIRKWLTGRTGLSIGMVRAMMVPVALYVLYAVIYLSGANAKSPAVRDEFRSLHPVLRLAVSTLILADDRILITDLSREPHDYISMGLRVRSASDHYLQRDGYAHAMDLRTRGRAEWKNLLVEAYFRVLGFRTLRHVGTADHLHVSLPSPRG